MCGIVGYVGHQEAAPILLDGLERLEYRGYDSAGIAVCGGGVLRLCKKKGRVAALRELSHNGGDLPGTLGIGHTRWATHGEPNDVNAHPHMSQSGKFAVVHNGIIENFITLKEELQQKGYVFQSETDTEVVAQLLDYYYSDCGDFFEAMNRLLHAVDGAYALGIICADYPDRLVAARKDAPLLLGFGDGENFIASDVTALIRHTRDIAYMDDGELAILSRSGIIENFITLKEELQQKGYVFQSETDTEVVAQLLDYYYSDCGDFFEAMNRLLHAVDGAYALGIICADYPDRLVAARKDAPLLLGFGDGENFIASDVTALIRHTRDIAYMDDGELAILSRSGIRVYDRQLRPVEKKHHHVDWEVDAAEKGGYAHFMLKEIMEQPAAIRKATAARIQGGRVVLQDLTMTPEQIRAMGRIYIVACGSSYHVGMVGKYNLERMLRRSVEVCLASEFRYADPIVGEGDLVIVISQSGETLDTMAALREAKKRGARILSIVNVVGSSIARESDDVLYTWAGPEIAVATTKAYSTQMAVLNLLGLYFGEVMGTVDYETYTAMVRDILALPEKLEQVLAQADRIREMAKDFAGRDDVFFIGRNLDYALSLEGSLKLKEISYIHSEAYASGELKHGTISLIEEGTPVIALSTYGPLFDKAMSNVVEVQARGANVLALTTETHRDAMAARTPRVLTVPEVEPMLLPQLGVAPLQLLAYYIALERGCDIDKPRNLAKSVTVE